MPRRAVPLLRSVTWPARLQPLSGRLRDMLPAGSELWLDGSHNAHGAAALALSLEEMQARRALPLVLIVGIMNTRPPRDFFAPFVPQHPRVFALAIPGEPNAHPAEAIGAGAAANGLEVTTRASVVTALRSAARLGPARVVICGSLYLAGDVLARNHTPPV